MGDETFAAFEGVVSDEESLRQVLGPPMQLAVDKVIDHIDDVSRAIIEKSPFALLASATADAYPDVSPKGDPAGFVRVIDENYIAIPDRPGNRRGDTLTNLLDNPYLAVIFLIPGKGETLRVSGECRIVRDRALRESMAVKGRVPELAIVMHVERVFIHCPKCVVRSSLWDPQAWPDTSDLPNVAEAMIAHTKVKITPDELVEIAEKEDVVRLY
ncbi:MAG TPA: MSMEG_1061 family FMN-dependent PPOX-type flavoprotein [Pseudomonadales bacterium]|jgi:PPOX class probable FMN-dependent enzyme